MRQMAPPSGFTGLRSQSFFTPHTLTNASHLGHFKVFQAPLSLHRGLDGFLSRALLLGFYPLSARKSSYSMGLAVVQPIRGSPKASLHQTGCSTTVSRPTGTELAIWQGRGQQSSTLWRDHPVTKRRPSSEVKRRRHSLPQGPARSLSRLLPLEDRPVGGQTTFELPFPVTNSTCFTSTPVFFLVKSSWSYLEKQCWGNSICAAPSPGSSNPIDPCALPDKALLPYPQKRHRQNPTVRAASAPLPPWLIT